MRKSTFKPQPWSQFDAFYVKSVPTMSVAEIDVIVYTEK